jgi:uncharacterized protein (TIGR03118 family)
MRVGSQLRVCGGVANSCSRLRALCVCNVAFSIVGGLVMDKSAFRKFKRSLVTMGIAVGGSCSYVWSVEAATYFQTDLVSDIPGLATLTEPELVNPWGLSHTTTSPFWTSNQGTSTATLFAVTGSTNVSKVTAVNPPTGNIAIPPTASGGPTGQVPNMNPSPSSFPVGNGGNGGSAHFIFGNLNGTISAWDTGATAFIQATTPGASYTGVAINQAQTQLYAANDAGTGGINVFNSAFAPVSLGASAFATPTAIGALGLVPFNVQDIGGNVYVTYAPAGHTLQTSATLGQGAVAIFSESGILSRTMVGGQLAAPWGVALAPSSFGPFGGDLLVGNFSYANSFISAFDPLTGTFEGQIPIDVGVGNTSGGLWSLDFGTGGNNGSPNTLYFTDGIDGETHGLFGAIEVTPIPAALPLFATGLGALGLIGWRRKRKSAGATAAA